MPLHPRGGWKRGFRSWGAPPPPPSSEPEGPRCFLGCYGILCSLPAVPVGTGSAARVDVQDTSLSACCSAGSEIAAPQNLPLPVLPCVLLPWRRRDGSQRHQPSFGGHSQSLSWVPLGAASSPISGCIPKAPLKGCWKPLGGNYGSGIDWGPVGSRMGEGSQDGVSHGWRCCGLAGQRGWL